MGYNPNCERCIEYPKVIQSEPCVEEEVIVEEVGNYCEPQCSTQMTSVPVITVSTENDFDPNDTCRKHINEFVRDPRNGKTYFFDVFGIMTLISDDGGSKKFAKSLTDKKQDRIQAHSPNKVYRVGDIVEKNGNFYQAIEERTGEFNDAYWRQIGGGGLAKDPAENKAYIYTADLPTENISQDKFYVLPNGDLYVYPSSAVGFVKINK